MIILDVLLNISKNIFTALYQYFWFALLTAILITICYLFVYKNNPSGLGLKKTIKLWLMSFKTSSEFRILFFWIFFTIMILFRTVLNRNLWLNPISDIFGDWWIYQKDIDGTLVLSTDCIENIILFIPYSFLLLWFLDKKNNYEKIGKLTLMNIKNSFFLSLIIEFTQLFLRVGTFQISDIVYNSLGGIIGSLMYMVVHVLLCLCSCTQTDKTPRHKSDKTG